jgi:hypothetical protein
MDDEMEIRFDSGRDRLVFGCGHAAFVRILDLVREHVGSSKFPEFPADAIFEIRILDSSRNAPDSWLRDRIGLIGCSLAAFALFMVFAAGLIQIISWARA